MTGPIVRGRASVCAWNLEFRFYDKSQCVKFIEKYMELDVTGSLNLKYEKILDDSLTIDEYWITIEDGCWAHNLTAIAKILEDVDFNAGVEE